MYQQLIKVENCGPSVIITCILVVLLSVFHGIHKDSLHSRFLNLSGL